VEELEAAKEAGLQTIQLVRPENTANWEKSVHDFSEIKL
jgi:methionine salvage enolase-phosphatase E1